MASDYISLPVEGGSGGVESFEGRTGVVTAQSGDYTASEITNVPAGSIAATDVQAAIDELDTEKQPLDATLTAIAAMSDGFPGDSIQTDGSGSTIFRRADYPTLRSRFLCDIVETGVLPGQAAFNGDGNCSVSTAVNYANHPGIALHNTGTGTTNYSILYGPLITAGKDFIFEAVINPLALSEVAEEYELWVGLINTPNQNVASNGIYFKYKRTVSVNWLMCTCAATTETETASSIAVTAGANTWQKLTIVCPVNRASISYYVDGVLAGTVSTNIPATTDYTYPMVKMIKTAGTTPATMYTDLIDLDLGVTR